MVTRVRRVLGAIALALAVRWAWLAWRGRQGSPAYPNEWGVRTAPLGRAELAAALAEERAIARRMHQWAAPTPP